MSFCYAFLNQKLSFVILVLSALVFHAETTAGNYPLMTQEMRKAVPI
jgi:hypothetical protein